MGCREFKSPQELLLLLWRGNSQAAEHRQCQALIIKIVLAVLSGTGRGHCEIEYIVGDLKRHSQSQPEDAELLLQWQRESRSTRSESAADGKQLARLAGNDAKVISFGAGLFQPSGDLVQFSFAGTVSSQPDQPAGFGIAAGGGKVECLGEQVVAEQHTGFGIPATMDRGHMPPQVCVVDHVVMNQRGSMNHLDHCAEQSCALAAFGPECGALKSGAEQSQNGADLFAAEAAGVISYILDEFGAIAKLSEQTLLHSLQVILQEVGNLQFQIFRGRADRCHWWVCPGGSPHTAVDRSDDDELFGEICRPGSGTSPGLGKQPNTADLQAFFCRLAHVIDRQAAHRNGSESFHLNTGAG